MRYSTRHFRTKLFGVAMLSALAFAASPLSARADEDDAAASCKVSYYLTAPYDDSTYDHVIVFEDDCDAPVTCELEGEGVNRTIVLKGPAEHRVTLSSDNDRPTFDATATCSAAR